MRSETSSPMNDAQSAHATVGDVFDWYRRHNPRESRSPVAAVEYARVRELFVSQFGQLPCENCKPFLLLNFIASQPGIKSNWTRRRWSVIIQSPFNHAWKLGLIERSPFRGAAFPAGPEGRDWTDKEFRAMLRCASPVFRRVLVCIRFSGMRPGEVREMEWSDVRESLNAVILDAKKTKTKVTRRIPFNLVLVKLFDWIRRHSANLDGPVFLNARGRVWTRSAVISRIDRLREAANLPPDVKLHGGRHSFATRAIVNGVGVATLAEILGHRSINTTQRYIHLANKTDHLAAAMAQAIGGKDGGK